jgi:hypothetical protein
LGATGEKRTYASHDENELPETCTGHFSIPSLLSAPGDIADSRQTLFVSE